MMQVRRSTLLLAAAFAGLLLVIGISLFEVLRNARLAQARVAELHSAHMQAGAALAQIRANVYSTGILTRDYLLDADPAHAQQYVDQFQAIRASTETSFQVLESSGQDQEQRAALDRLRHELNAYWDPTEVILDWTPEEKRAQRSRMLRQRVGRRQEIFAMARQVEHLIAGNFAREQLRLTNADRDFRVSLGWTTAAALLLSIAIISVTLVRMNSLEHQSQAAQAELRRLSVQLRTAQEQERKFLSRELHDQVGQMLTALRMELASIARTHADAESEFSARLARAKGTVEQTLRIVRNIAMLLRPSMLDDLGLSPALAWHMKEFSRTTGINVEPDIDPAVDSLPDPHRTCLYRIVQEALTNCARHSAAKNVTVSLTVDKEGIAGVVADDGRGFSEAAVKSKGLGVLGMEERVRELDGTIRVVSTAGEGTRVEIRMPLPRPPEDMDDSHPDRGRSRDRSDRVEATA